MSAAAVARQVVVEVLVQPWSQHSSAARRAILALLLGGGLLKTAVGALRTKRDGGGNAGAAGAGGVAATGATGSGGKAGPIRRVLGLVLPKRGERNWAQSGLIEMVLVVVFNAARLAMELVSANMMRESFALPMTRDRARFNAFLVKSTVFHIGANVFGTISGQVDARLARRWRLRLTDVGHTQYFEGANFYRVEREMKDADLRLTDDVSRLAHGCTSFFTQGVHTGFTLVSFGGLAVWQFGLAYTAIPFVFVIGGGMVKDLLAPMDWSIMTSVEGKRAHYRDAWTRVVRNAESIAALRGSDTEATLLRSRFGVLVDERSNLNRRLATFDAGNTLMWKYMLHNLFVVVLTAPGTWREDSGAAETLEMATDRYSAIGLQLHLVMQLLGAAARLHSIHEEYKRLTGNATRFIGLLDELEKVSAMERLSRSENIIEGDAISFANVTIKTPAGYELVRNLSFEVGQNDSMLLTGHNGAGKSSVFRCLAGLWHVETGQITKPGGSHGAGAAAGQPTEAVAGSLAGTVYYLPQKPYQVLGTLFDQISYPAESSQGLTRERAVEILEEVELGYLADRPEIFTKETNWEEEISLGEKQRLAIARLIYHEPRIAVLDECTSAVSTSMEERLYWLLNLKGITYITISHRPVLEAFHRKILCINGDEEKTYRYEELQTKYELERHVQQGLRSQSVRTVSKAEIDEGSAALEARSVPFSNVAEARTDRFASFKAQFDSVSFLSRLTRLLRLGLRPSSVVKFGMLMAIMVLKLGADFSGVLLTQTMLGAMQQRNKTQFIRGVCFLFVRAAVGTIVDVLGSLTQRTLALQLSSELVHGIQDKALSNSMYYKLKNVDGRIDDLDTRLVDDANQFSETLSGMSDRLCWPILSGLWYASRVTSAVSRSSAILMWGYMAGAGIVLKFVMPNYKAIVAEISDLEGKYKRVHNNVRAASESIAFFGGGSRERKVVRGRLESLIDVHVRKAWLDVWFGPLRHILLHVAPDKLQDTIKFNHLAEKYRDEESILVDNGAAIGMDIQMLWESGDKVYDSVRSLIGFADVLNSFSGITARVSELVEVIEEIEKEETERDLAASLLSGGREKPGAIVFNSVDLLTPTALCLGAKINATVADGEGLMVTGPNAAGKTSFVRVLAGLWAPGGGSVSAAQDEIAIVPQRVYSCIGSLQDQITYPTIIPAAERTAELAQKMRRLLNIVGIEYLVDREKDEYLTKARTAAIQRAALEQEQLRSTMPIDWQSYANDDGTASDKGGVSSQIAALRKEEQDSLNAARVLETAGGGWDTVRVWEETLSLGEQQRLAMARFFFRSPRFGVLDECTSAVSVDVEQQLYRAAAEQGITCVTISQRLALAQFHTTELSMGRPTPAGWELSTISDDARTREANYLKGGPIESPEARRERLAAGRTADYRKLSSSNSSY